MARSACWSSSIGSSPSSGARAMPTLGRDRLRPRPEPEGTAEAGPQPLGDLRRPARRRHRRSRTANSSPPMPRHHVVAAHRLPQPRGHQAEQLVPVVVAEGVVDVLEVVEVDDEHREAAVGRRGRAVARASASLNDRRLASPVSSSVRASRRCSASDRTARKDSPVRAIATATPAAGEADAQPRDVLARGEDQQPEADQGEQRGQHHVRQRVPRAASRARPGSHPAAATRRHERRGTPTTAACRDGSVPVADWYTKTQSMTAKPTSPAASAQTAGRRLPLEDHQQADDHDEQHQVQHRIGQVHHDGRRRVFPGRRATAPSGRAAPPRPPRPPGRPPRRRAAGSSTAGGSAAGPARPARPA